VVNRSEAVIERIRDLEGQLAGARINSVRHRQLTKAIHAQADLYRCSLDHEQAEERFDPKPVLPPFDPAARPRARPAKVTAWAPVVARAARWRRPPRS